MFSGVLPKVVSDVGPGGRYISTMNALNDTYKSSAEAKYAPYQAYGNAALVNQQAKWLPYQYQMQALSNPVLWMAAQNNPTLRDQLTKMMGNPMQDQGTTGSNFNMPEPNQNPLSNLVRNIKGAFGLNGGSNPLSNMTSASQPGTASPTNALNAATSSQPASVSPDASLSDITGQQGKGLPSTTVGRAGANDPLAGVNDLSVAEANKAALNTTATGEASSQNEQWKIAEDNATNGATNGLNNVNLINKLNKAYEDLNPFEKGPGFGSGPHISTAAQVTDATAQALADSVARMQQDGHITMQDRNIYESMKPNRGMSDDAFKQSSDFMKGMSDRVQEEPAFLAAARKAGLTPTQSKIVWNYYGNKKPFYNSNKSEINRNNLGRWEDFLTPKKVKEALSPKEARAALNEDTTTNASSENDEHQGQEPPIHTVWMIRPDGKKVVVHESNIDVATNKYHFKPVD
jgi:hypothetical protein